MTALSLFDVLVSRQGGRGAPDLSGFAAQLVQSALADLQRIGEYERQYGAAATGDAEFQRQLTRSVYDLYSDWARDAEQILVRVGELTSAGTVVAEARELVDAHGRVRARLSVTPQQVADAQRQVREGRTIPASELRDELRARIRA
jgi:hypothetical protein